MQDKNNQNLNIKNKKDQINKKLDNNKQNLNISNQNDSEKNKTQEINSQNPEKKINNKNTQIQTNNQGNKTLNNNKNENVISSETKSNKFKKSCYSNSQLAEVKIKRNRDKSDENDMKNLKHMIQYISKQQLENEYKTNHNKSKEIKNLMNEHLMVKNSDKNLIKMKKPKKNLEFLSESARFHEKDTLEEVGITKPSYFIKHKNHSNSISNYKSKHNPSRLKNEKEKESKNNKSIFHKKKIEEEKQNENEKKANTNIFEDIYEDIIINDCEFENSKNIQDQNLEKTKFPNLCMNPFAADSNSVKKNDKRFSIPICKNISDLNKKLLMNSNEEKEKISEQYTEYSSTIGSNNKISTSNLNTSNVNSSVEILKSKSSKSNTQIKNTNLEYSNSDTEKNYKNFLLLAKRGDKVNFSDFFKKFTSKDKPMDINYQDEEGNTALHYSCDEGNLKIVEILLNAKCNTNIVNKKNETPLHLASKRGYFDISKILIEKGALLNVYDSLKNSPLHYVCKNNYIEILNYFLSKSPQLNEKNNDGKMPIDLTTNNEIKESIQNYLNKNENKIEKNKSNENSDSKRKTIDKRPYGNSKSDKRNSIKNESFEKEINLSDKSKNKISTRTSNKTSSNDLRDITDTKKIRPTNPFENNTDINVNTKNKSTSNIISLNFQNIKIGDTKKSNLFLINNNKRTKNSPSKKESDKDNTNNKKSKKEETNNKNPTKENYDKENKINPDEYIKNELKKSNTTARLSSKERNKLNNSSLYKIVKKVNASINEIKNEESINSYKKITSNSKGRNEKKLAANSIDKQKTYTGNRGILIKNKSKFYKNQDTLTDSQETPSSNKVGNNNKTEDISKKKSKKIKITIRNSTKLRNTSNIFLLDTSDKITPKTKTKTNLKKDYKNKRNTMKNCNLSYEQKTENNNNTIDSINKRKKSDKTADNIQNSLDLNSITEERITLSNFLCLAQLGKGSFGEVYLVQKINTQEKYAMKVLRKERIFGQNLLKYALAERNILSVTDHPFIVKLNCAFQNTTKLFLILEYCPNGDLGKHLLVEKRFSEERAKFYLCEVLLALENLHQRDIIFRDLKPDNVVLDGEGHCKLTDFGLSKEGVNETKYAQSFCGSIAYLAPEMLKKKGHGKAVDWYLLGVLFYEMLVGCPPFFTRRQEDIFNNIERGELNIPDFVSPAAADLLRKLLERDPSKRLGSTNDAQEIKDYPYFKDVDWNKVYNKEIKPPTFLDYSKNSINAYNKPRKFIIDDLFESNYPNKLMGWSFINDEE